MIRLLKSDAHEDTPGCTTQACGIRDRHNDYEAAGARVIGVLPDQVDAIAGFAAKHSLGFTLLADPDHVGRGGLRDLGREAQLREEALGSAVGDLSHRHRRADRPRDDEVHANLAQLTAT